MKMLFAETPAPKLNLGKKLWLLNWPFLLLVAGIALVGAGALYSVAGGTFEPWATRHVVRFCIGLALLFAVAFSDIRWWLNGAYPLYLAVLLLMLLVPFIGVESGGARRWLGVGELSFQPSEMAKLAVPMLGPCGDEVRRVALARASLAEEQIRIDQELPFLVDRPKLAFVLRAVGGKRDQTIVA